MESADLKVLKVARDLALGAATCTAAADELTRITDVSPKYVTLMHFLYHYVADEDLRARDDGYSKLQSEQLHQLIAQVS
jgi:hypothetical protein